MSKRRNMIYSVSSRRHIADSKVKIISIRSIVRRWNVVKVVLRISLARNMKQLGRGRLLPCSGRDGAAAYGHKTDQDEQLVHSKCTRIICSFHNGTYFQNFARTYMLSKFSFNSLFYAPFRIIIMTV